MSGKLVRRDSDTKITGVCAALGRYFGIDPTVVRILFVLASIFGVGSPILIYIILSIVIPHDK